MTKAQAAQLKKAQDGWKSTESALKSAEADRAHLTKVLAKQNEELVRARADAAKANGWQRRLSESEMQYSALHLNRLESEKNLKKQIADLNQRCTEAESLASRHAAMVRLLSTEVVALRVGVDNQRRREQRKAKAAAKAVTRPRHVSMSAGIPVHLL